MSHGLCGVGAMPVRAGGPGGQGGAGTGLPWSCGHVVMWSPGHVIWFSFVK